MGLKFAGRTPSRGSRFLRGAPGVRGPHTGPVFFSTSSFLALALLLGVLCLAVALLRSSLGAPQAAFWPVLFSLPVIALRLCHQATPDAALWLAGGVLAGATLWHIAARLLNRRAPDALLLAVLAFQAFFVARYAGTFLPPAGPLSISALSLPQKINAGLQLLLLLLAALWSTHPLASAGYESSAPSRVMSFLKKRRMPLRIAGALMVAFAIIATYAISEIGFQESSTLPVFQPPLIFALYLALDGCYFVGRALWQRIH